MTSGLHRDSWFRSLAVLFLGGAVMFGGGGVWIAAFREIGAELSAIDEPQTRIDPEPLPGWIVWLAFVLGSIGAVALIGAFSDLRTAQASAPPSKAGRALRRVSETIGFAAMTIGALPLVLLALAAVTLLLATGARFVGQIVGMIAMILLPLVIVIVIVPQFVARVIRGKPTRAAARPRRAPVPAPTPKATVAVSAIQTEVPREPKLTTEAHPSRSDHPPPSLASTVRNSVSVSSSCSVGC